MKSDLREYKLKEYEQIGNLLYIDGEFYEELESYIEDEFFRDNKKHKGIIDDVYILTSLPVIYGSQKMLIGLEVEDIITMLEQHDYVYEGYEVSDYAEKFIKMAVKHFNENYAEYSYIVDEETVITPTLGEVSEICTRVKKRRGWIYE